MSVRPTISFKVRKPKLGHEFAHFLGDEAHEVDRVGGIAREIFPQFGILRGHADRAGVEMADAHHDAAQGDKRRGGKAEFLRAKQRGNDHVAARL